ncbi:MAG: Hsp70 family protein [Acidimicrobiales bacterium]
MKKPFEAAIKDAGLKQSDIDHVVMVGGSTGCLRSPSWSRP